MKDSENILEGLLYRGAEINFRNTRKTYTAEKDVQMSYYDTRTQTQIEETESRAPRRIGCSTLEMHHHLKKLSERHFYYPFYHGDEGRTTISVDHRVPALKPQEPRQPFVWGRKCGHSRDQFLTPTTVLNWSPIAYFVLVSCLPLRE